MSILDRLDLLVRSNISDAFGDRSRADALSEMENSLRQARRKQAELRRGEKELIEQIREARDRADQWEERAMLALRNDDEELAREALVVKNEAMREAGRLRDQLDDHRQHMQDIERALEALEHKLEGTRNRIRARSDDKRRLESGRSSGGSRAAKWDEKLRRRTGKAPPGDRGADSAPASETSDAFDTSEEFREMDRMAGKIDGMEAEIEAMRELDDIGGDSRRAKLERKFRSMEQKEGRSRRRRRGSESDEDRGGDRSDDRPPIDDDLSDLKKKFE